MKRFFILVLILQIHFAFTPCTIYGAIINGADDEKKGNVTTPDNKPDFYYDGSTPLKYWIFYANNQVKNPNNNKDVYVMAYDIMSDEEANKLNISLQNYTKLTIPGEFDCEGTHCIVAGIGNGCFLHKNGIVEVVMPDSITYLATDAFNECPDLKEVTMSKNISTFSPTVFSYCTSLTNIHVRPGGKYLKSIDGVVFSADGDTLVCYPYGRKGSYNVPKGVKHLGTSAMVANGLQSVTLPEGLLTIGDKAFYWDQSLTHVNIPKTVRSIGKYAFGKCGIKDDIVIPEGVTIIQKNAFYDCPLLKHITLPQSLTVIEEQAFAYCKLKEILLPSHLEKIGEDAFVCNAFENVTIPASVKEIGISPFGSGLFLSTINVDKNNPNYVSIDGVLFSKDMKTLVEYPNGKKENSYIVPDGVETIAKQAFFSVDDYLEIIRMPESLLFIGESAFTYCDASIHLPSGVQSIEVRALEGVVYVPDNSLKRYKKSGIFQSNYFYEPKVEIRPESDFFKLPYYSIEDLLFKPFVQVDLGKKNLWDMTIDDVKKKVDNPKQLEESSFESNTLNIYKKEGFVEYRKGEKYPKIILSRLKYDSETRKVIYLANSISCAGYEKELAQYACNILKEKDYSIIKENEEKNAAIFVNKEKTDIAFAVPDTSRKKVFIGRIPIDSKYYDILLKSIE